MFSTPGIQPVVSSSEATGAQHGQAKAGILGHLPEVPVNRGSRPAADEPLPSDGPATVQIPHELIEQLYRTESPRLLRALSRSAGGADEAQDLVQEVFCRLARMGHQLTKLERPHAYLKRIATNLARDQSRQSIRKHYSLHLVADEESLAGADQTRLLESRDMLNRLEAAIIRLRPKTREIFMAHRIDGLSYAQIAEQTGLSIKGIEKQMSKALQQIDRMLSRS
jgi:RNA polymerase sigma-70 factor (ECF subfamily)